MRKSLLCSVLFCVFCMALVVSCIMFSCSQENSQVANGVFEAKRSPASLGADFDLADIQEGGELIVLTLYGPISYFEYKGESFGNQYKLADVFARSIGVSVRVDVCRSENEMLLKLQKGDGDVVAYQMPVEDSLAQEVKFCGVIPITHFVDSLATLLKDFSLVSAHEMAWAVRPNSNQLADTLNQWLAQNESDFFHLSMPRVADEKGEKLAPRRNPKSPVLNLAKGQISEYDRMFKTYAKNCGWDWRLLAAQAYQESAFDPEAVSWMGALGLMQLMPGTAEEMGVAKSEVFNAESNIRGAVKLISNLNRYYSFIKDRDERINFVLAAYNAGAGHVDDARHIAEKYGKNPNRWFGNVDEYVLLMSQSEYYNDSIAQHGYFRGSETYNYVNNIRARWKEYKRKVR